MKKTLLVLEFEEKCRNKIVKTIESWNLNIKIIAVDSLAKAYRIALETSIDIFLVDTILENKNPTDVSGIYFIEKIRQIPKYKFVPVIFLSSLEDSKVYAYKELNCIGFLKKPYQDKILCRLLEKASFNRTRRSVDNTLLFRKNGIIYPVKIGNIMYIERIDKLMHIYCVDGSILEIPYKTHKQILREADSDCLMFCNRSTLVNKEYVENIDIPNRYIELKYNKGKLDIGVTYKNKILEEYENY